MSPNRRRRGRRKETIRPAPPGVEAGWNIRRHPDGTVELEIQLADDLDELTRQRYVHDARVAAGWETEHRRTIIPLLLPITEAGKHARAAVQNHTASALAAVLIISGAAGFAAYTATIADSGHQPAPPAAAPMPPQPSPAPAHHPARQSRRTPRPDATTGSPPAATVPVTAAATGALHGTPLAHHIPAVRVPKLMRHVPALPPLPVKQPPAPLPPHPQSGILPMDASHA